MSGDPYLIAGTDVLHNRAGITDADQLGPLRSPHGNRYAGYLPELETQTLAA